MREENLGAQADVQLIDGVGLILGPLNAGFIELRSVLKNIPLSHVSSEKESASTYLEL